MHDRFRICGPAHTSYSSGRFQSVTVGSQCSSPAEYRKAQSLVLYAVSSWWGFASAADRQRLQALLQRGIRSGLCSPETPNLTELAESVDDTLFQRIMHNPYHVLYHLLPERRELVYNIRPRHHDRQLSIISGQLRKRNFIYRMLFKDSY